MVSAAGFEDHLRFFIAVHPVPAVVVQAEEVQFVAWVFMWVLPRLESAAQLCVQHYCFSE